MKFEYSIQVTDPLGGPSITYHGDCEVVWYGEDFNGFMPLTVFRDGHELTPEQLTGKDWNGFLNNLRWGIRERDVKQKPSSNIAAAAKASPGGVTVSIRGGRESNAREIEIESIKL